MAGQTVQCNVWQLCLALEDQALQVCSMHRWLERRDGGICAADDRQGGEAGGQVGAGGGVAAAAACFKGLPGGSPDLQVPQGCHATQGCGQGASPVEMKRGRNLKGGAEVSQGKCWLLHKIVLLKQALQPTRTPTQTHTPKVVGSKNVCADFSTPKYQHDFTHKATAVAQRLAWLYLSGSDRVTVSLPASFSSERRVRVESPLMAAARQLLSSCRSCQRTGGCKVRSGC